MEKLKMPALYAEVQITRRHIEDLSSTVVLLGFFFSLPFICLYISVFDLGFL
jgi:hypothetical protein